MEKCHINVRINRDVKKQGEQVLAKLGLKHSSFIHMLYAQLVENKVLPFEIVNLDEKNFDDKINFKINPQIKAQSAEILNHYGLTNSTFLRLSYYHLIKNQKLPFKNIGIN